MNTVSTHIVTVNAGSSSIKLALFEPGESPKKILEGVIDNIGQPTASFTKKNGTAQDAIGARVSVVDHVAAVRMLIDWVREQTAQEKIAAISHRIVHGGVDYYTPHLINNNLLAGLRTLTIFDPEHLPVAIKIIEMFQVLFPQTPQVACFDTAFHHDLPRVAQILPIPRRFEATGVRRYGFHGLSCAFVLQELQRRAGQDVANGRLIIAHLGSGVSLTAVRGGKSIDTTMGLTPASGVPMSTRSGDIDPGLALYLARSQDFSADQFSDMVNFKSGLLGISETSADMKTLLEHEAHDNRAKEAIDVFCYQVKKSIGSLAAVLGGVDTLIFTGGMGENAPKVRARICSGLEFLGIKIEALRNTAGAEIISADAGAVVVRVIHTDEASTMAQDAWQLLSKRKV